MIVPKNISEEFSEYINCPMSGIHLDTIPEKESDEVIKSSVEDLVPIPSESEDFSDNESECDVPVDDESSPTFTTFLNPLFDSKLRFHPLLMLSSHFLMSQELRKTGLWIREEIEEVEDVILRDKLSNVYLLISKIEALNDNPTLSSFSYSDNSFSDHMEETRSGSTTTHANYSLPEYDSFLF
ncbi:hypothetical protein Tco_0576265 [Tanacetum coccineum]